MHISCTLVFLCSPHKDGITDRLGLAAAAGASLSSGGQVQIVRISQYRIKPCCGCGHCFEKAGLCKLKPDAADALFASILSASALIFAVPVYFYALPGQLKIFIDRSQKFWGTTISSSSHLRAAVIMAAARKQGEKLFSGSLLTLKWFLKPFSFSISETLLFRGLESCADLEYRQLVQAFAVGRRLVSTASKKHEIPCKL